MDTQLQIGGREFRSRFMIGTGKYASDEVMNQCLAGVY
jgi:thiazole synthase ThiGH ThiG subunit